MEWEKTLKPFKIDKERCDLSQGQNVGGHVNDVHVHTRWKNDKNEVRRSTRPLKNIDILSSLLQSLSLLIWQDPISFSFK